ncbi:MAG: RraA family protein [Promethearchaeota archaeon]
MLVKRKEAKAIVSEYSRLYTCAVSDAIDELGLPPGFLDAGFRPVWPGARLVGFAGTVRMVESDAPLDRDVIAKMAKYLPQMPPSAVFCVGMGGKMVAAGLGQSTCRILQGFGFRGGIVDGPVRDVAQVTALKFPVFSKGFVCSSIRGRMVVDYDSINQPLEFGGRVVNPGDLVFGDINGVVVVPGEDVGRVLERAKEIISTDSWWFEQLEAGREPTELEREKPLP